MDLAGYQHGKGDMVHNFALGLSIFDHPKLPITKPLKVTPSHVKLHNELSHPMW
jgi:hypothetical protein